MESAQTKVMRLLKEALEAVQEATPEDRSSVARRYAVVATMLEKVVAYFGYWIVRIDDTAKQEYIHIDDTAKQE